MFLNLLFRVVAVHKFKFNLPENRYWIHSLFIASSGDCSFALHRNTILSPELHTQGRREFAILSFLLSAFTAPLRLLPYIYLPLLYRYIQKIDVQSHLPCTHFPYKNISKWVRSRHTEGLDLKYWVGCRFFSPHFFKGVPVKIRHYSMNHLYCSSPVRALQIPSESRVALSDLSRKLSI